MLTTQDDNVLWEEYLESACDEGEPDFIVTQCDQHFRVHKRVLSAKSDYFRAMFSSAQGQFKENEQCQVNITDHEDDYVLCEVFRALLSFMYTGDFMFDSAILDTYLHMDDWGHFSNDGLELPAYTRLSDIADRFLVKGVDSIIARKIFSTLNFANSDPFRTMTPEPRILRANDDFIDAVTQIWRRVHQQDDQESQDLIASFLNHHVQGAIFQPGSDSAFDTALRTCLDELPALKNRMLLDLHERPLRYECPNCTATSRECPRRATWLGDHHCDTCDKSAPFSEWSCTFLENLQDALGWEICSSWS
ncbi:MAG: hypothetical protein Q9159_001100 [Coniocarpon cinnabarinum]